MSRFAFVVFALVAALFVGCGHPSVSVGDTTIGSVSYHVVAEGSNAPGSTSRYAIQPAAGTTGITTVQAWVGTDAAGTGATRVTGVFDAVDGDYDVDVMIPNPVPSGAQLWISVTRGESTDTGSIALSAAN